MTFESGCYCGKICYRAEGQPPLKAQCHCRECQYISGGVPNLFILMPAARLSLHTRRTAQLLAFHLENPVSSPQRNPSRRMVTGAGFTADSLIYS